MVPAVARRTLTSRASADVVVVGAGVVGVACAHYLSRRGARVLLLDYRPPLSHTSSLSTECYRNYWAGNGPMTAFMDRSIDLLEARAAECGNAFSMNRRGYCFLTRTQEGAERHAAAAAAATRTGIGGGAIHTDGQHGVAYRGAALPYDASVDGLTVFQGADAIRSFFSRGGLPDFVSPEVTSLLHCGRCGWMNAQQMGSALLEGARAYGTSTLIPATLTAVTTDADGSDGGGGRVTGVVVSTPDEAARHIACGAVVNAAGPYARHVGELLTSAAAPPLPLENEVHAKVMLRDDQGAVPPEAPMMIYEDDVTLPWSDEEADALRGMGGFEASLTRPLAAGAHFRPYPGATSTLLLLWEALHADMQVAEPPPAEPELRGSLFAELLLRGLSPMVPALGSAYLSEDGSMRANVSIDGGYYTRTPDNLPLVGAMAGAPRGAYVCAGLSGYGVMGANAAGELLAGLMSGEAPPAAFEYDETFDPERWSRPEYVRKVAAGQSGRGLQI